MKRIPIVGLTIGLALLTSCASPPPPSQTANTVPVQAAQQTPQGNDIIIVPTAQELMKGAKIESVKPECLQEYLLTNGLYAQANVLYRQTNHSIYAIMRSTPRVQPSDAPQMVAIRWSKNPKVGVLVPIGTDIKTINLDNVSAFEIYACTPSHMKDVWTFTSATEDSPDLKISGPICAVWPSDEGIELLERNGNMTRPVILFKKDGTLAFLNK